MDGGISRHSVLRGKKRIIKHYATRSYQPEIGVHHTPQLIYLRSLLQVSLWAMCSLHLSPFFSISLPSPYHFALCFLEQNVRPVT